MKLNHNKKQCKELEEPIEHAHIGSNILQQLFVDEN
jgi:hypothetical protein